MEDKLDPIFQLIIERENRKGVNFTVEDLLKVPLKESPVLSIVFLCALSLSCLVGVIGNILVIGSVIVSRKLRTTGNYFIINLAIADLIVVVIVEPFNIIGTVDGAGFFIRNVWVCHALSVFCVMACVCSMMNLAAIAVNRYIMINKYQLYKDIFTRGKTILLCALLWAIAFLIELPNLAGWGGHTFDLKSLSCSFDRLINLYYTIFLSITALWIPLSIIMFCYLKIYFFVQRSRRQIEKKMGQQTKKDKKKSKRQKEDVKLARTFFLVFMTFLICWTPYDLTLFLDRADVWPQWLYLLLLQIGHLNSSLNSILYGVTNSRFREGYRLFLMQICKSKKTGKLEFKSQTTTESTLSSSSDNNL